MHTTQPGRCRQVSRKFLAGVDRCQENFWQVLASGMCQHLWQLTVGQRPLGGGGGGWHPRTRGAGPHDPGVRTGLGFRTTNYLSLVSNHWGRGKGQGQKHSPLQSEGACSACSGVWVVPLHEGAGQSRSPLCCKGACWRHACCAGPRLYFVLARVWRLMEVANGSRVLLGGGGDHTGKQRPKPKPKLLPLSLALHLSPSLPLPLLLPCPSLASAPVPALLLMPEAPGRRSQEDGREEGLRG